MRKQLALIVVILAAGLTLSGITCTIDIDDLLSMLGLASIAEVTELYVPPQIGGGPR